VRPSSSLREVLGLLAEHRLHRVHVIDDRQRPVGIVTITDLLRVIVGCNDLLEALGPVSGWCACAGRCPALVHVHVMVLGLVLADDWVNPRVLGRLRAEVHRTQPQAATQL
jgi:hypothetical protein